MTDNTFTIKETYYPDSTQIDSRRCYNAQNQLHNPTGPAFESWHSNGQLAYQLFNINDVLHNPAGPAVEYWCSDGQPRRQAFYLNGEELVEVKNISKIAGVEYTARN